jgi:hypothetical protein
MAGHKGGSEPAQNAGDLLGAPDRAGYEDGLGSPDPEGREDVLGAQIRKAGRMSWRHDGDRTAQRIRAQ